ncbi:DUF357 domain-containing protein [Candidatus Pacearchaeota archaeon]|nr:DUF357 domain-containing protein [Candidatus Pacearchaeota archaeon]
MQKEKQDKITEEKIEKYLKLTETALEIAKNSITKSREKEAEQIIQMVSCYLSDSKFFKKQNDYINSFASINYAHGWLDSGSRLGIFNVKDNKLFVIK